MTIEEIAFKEFENVGDEKLFPNHTDKDIWVSGFVKGYLLAKRIPDELPPCTKCGMIGKPFCDDADCEQKTR